MEPHSTVTIELKLHTQKRKKFYSVLSDYIFERDKVDSSLNSFLECIAVDQSKLIEYAVAFKKVEECKNEILNDLYVKSNRLFRKKSSYPSIFLLGSKNFQESNFVIHFWGYINFFNTFKVFKSEFNSIECQILLSNFHGLFDSNSETIPSNIKQGHDSSSFSSLLFDIVYGYTRETQTHNASLTVLKRLCKNLFELVESYFSEFPKQTKL